MSLNGNMYEIINWKCFALGETKIVFSYPELLLVLFINTFLLWQINTGVKKVSLRESLTTRRFTCYRDTEIKQTAKTKPLRICKDKLPLLKDGYLYYFPCYVALFY